MWKDFFYFTKTERQGIIVLVVLVIGVYTIYLFHKRSKAGQEISSLQRQVFIARLSEKRNQTGSVRSEYRRLRHFPQSRLAYLDGGQYSAIPQKARQIPTSGRLSENIRADGRTIPDSSTVYTHCRNTGPSRYQPDISSTSDCTI